MFFLRTQERGRHFDSFVENTDAALREPEVAAILGDLATLALEANARVFLPNISCGRAEIPAEYQGREDAIAVLPLLGNEPKRAEKIIDPLLSVGGWLNSYDEVVISPVSGVELPRQALAPAVAGMQSAGAKKVNSSFTARTSARGCSTIVWDASDQERVREARSYSSRPVETINTNIAPPAHDKWGQAGMLAHEHLHAQDILHNFLLYSQVLGRAASELAAYHVSDVLYSRSPQPHPSYGTVQRMEELRVATVDPESPFVPSPALLEEMFAEGFIH